jgi:mRNA interferase RelE/StbE
MHLALSNMAFILVYTKSAVDNIRKLDIVAKKRIKKKLEEYAKNPLYYAKRLAHFAIGEYRWRVGNYRIVFDIKDRTIIVLRIRHRREIYQ